MTRGERPEDSGDAGNGSKAESALASGEWSEAGSSSALPDLRLSILIPKVQTRSAAERQHSQNDASCVPRKPNGLANIRNPH
jgi:hypothetical protein